MKKLLFTFLLTLSVISLTNIQEVKAEEAPPSLAQSFHRLLSLFNSYLAQLRHTQTADGLLALSNGLVAHYTFDGNAGNGSVSGGATYVTGKIGQAILLNGSNSSYVLLPEDGERKSVVEGKSAVTVATWVKVEDPVGSGNTRLILNQGGAGRDPIIMDFARGTGTNDFKYRCAVDNGEFTTAVVSAQQYNNTDWHHVACAYNGSTVTLYVDGTPRTSAAISCAAGAPCPLAITDNTLTIGIPGVTTFNGLIDDLRVYSKSLSQGEINDLFALGGGSPVSDPGPTPNPSDTTPPTVSIASPLNNASVSGTITVSATASDAVGMNNVQFKLDGNNLNAADTSSPYSTNWNTTTASNGTHTLTAVATDNAGNTTTSSSIAVSVSNIGTPEANTTNNLIVDQDHPNANDNNTGTENFPFKTIQKAVDVVQAGQTIRIKAGTYQNSCVVDACNFVLIDKVGTRQNPITIKPYGNGRVILRGIGFSDLDGNNDGRADGNTDGRNEVLLNIASGARHIHVEGLEFTNSALDGIVIKGSFNRIENVKVSHNWASGISIGGNNRDEVRGNVVTGVESHHNRHGGGIVFARNSQATGLLTENIIENSLVYRNGFDANDQKVLPINGDVEGGGNSDGAGSSKGCSDNPYFANPEHVLYLDGNGDGVNEPYSNICVKNVISNVIAFFNSDDGFDNSLADSLLINNIAFANYSDSRSHKGFKTLRPTYKMIYVGNIAYANDGQGFEFRSNGGAEFLNNVAVDNKNQGLMGLGGTTKTQNNIGYLNDMSDITLASPCTTCSNNWIGDRSGALTGDPKFVNNAPFKNTQGNIEVVFPRASMTPLEKVNWIREQFKNAFSLKSDSGAIDAGVPVSYVNPLTNQSVSIIYSGSAPDLGAFEYGATGGGTYTPPPSNNNPPPVTPPRTDTDSDGVLDSQDLCPSTPTTYRSSVNRYGCIRPTVTGFDTRPDVEQDLRQITNLRFGRTGIGEVRFLEQVNLLRNNAPIDVTRGLSIERNKVSLDSNSLPELNKRAEITLITTLTNPKILKDGTTCTTCIIRSFTNNTIIFEVPSFSTYEVVEGDTPPTVTPEPETSNTSSGGRSRTTTYGTATQTTTPDFSKMTKDQAISWIKAKLIELITELNVRLKAEGKPLMVVPNFPSTQPLTPSASHIFNTDLYLNINHPDVWHLQRFLNTHGYPVGTNVGSYGKEVNTFGPVTKATLQKFQQANGIPATGYFGPETRARVNGMNK